MQGQQAAASRHVITRYASLAPTCAASLVVTELFFKFGSFTLELVGMAALWGALYGIQVGASRLLRR